MVVLTVEKSADKKYVFIGISNKIKYSVIITNTGTTKATCVKIKDELSFGARYIPGTFSINGAIQNIKSIDDYVSIGAIKPGSNIVISYDVEIVQCTTPKNIINQASVLYCDNNGNMQEVKSQELVIPAIQISVISNKSVDKETAKIGEILNYSVFIRNDSNIVIEDIVFFDDLNESLELLPGSFLINLNLKYVNDLSQGVELGSLNPYTGIVINFQAKVNSLPNSDVVNNTSRVEFVYTIDDIGSNVSAKSVGVACSNNVITVIDNETITC